MAENAVNHIIGALEIAVGWLKIGVKVQEAAIKGILSFLEALKMGD